MATRKVTSLPYTELPTPPAVLPDTNYGTSRSTIDRIVLHTMVGTVSSANSRFCSYGTQVSAHYGIGLNGKINHWLEETLTAYHAGDYAMNLRSIGIEHEDGGNYNGPRTPSLYATAAKLVADICKFYGIPCDRTHILKHNEIIPTGCPDALDVDRIVRDAYAILHPIVPKLDVIAELKIELLSGDTPIDKVENCKKLLKI
jgi:N-acetyl-anhydromuramyl-L-alanine amidase AmpD